MLYILFFIALMWVTVKLLALGVKLAWSIIQFVCSVILFPLLMVGLVAIGMIYLAIPILIIVWIYSVVRGLTA